MNINLKRALVLRKNYLAELNELQAKLSDPVSDLEQVQKRADELVTALAALCVVIGDRYDLCLNEEKGEWQIV